MKWKGELAVGKQVSAVIPGWLAAKHRQLAGDDKFDFAKPLDPVPSNARNMSGALFRNQGKEKDIQPDYNGDVTIAGTKYRLAGWLKTGKNGKFLSLAVSEHRGSNYLFWLGHKQNKTRHLTRIKMGEIYSLI